MARPICGSLLCPFTDTSVYGTAPVRRGNKIPWACDCENHLLVYTQVVASTSPGKILKQRTEYNVNLFQACRNGLH